MVCEQPFQPSARHQVAVLAHHRGQRRPCFLNVEVIQPVATHLISQRSINGRCRAARSKDTQDPSHTPIGTPARLRIEVRFCTFCRSDPVEFFEVGQ
ncbi:hypothetical protein VQ02_29820 [Methylobacterium variabile]|uniref:Uncharacterized protein n=1 Tax=Methylobacterium variabile TaxID=298794 RepID=A0A0J6S7J9_9HYPH|nr:hypothetical protein VQ02_29820 [Methylobacterium variabile]